MSLLNRTSLVALCAVGVGHFGPYATAIQPLRRRFLPGLAGVGNSLTVAITFDDGPDPLSTPQILDELERLALTATFFVLGSMVRNAPELTRELVDRGHEVGLHGDAHRSHILRSPLAVYNDLSRSLDTVCEATGAPVTLFRPPYGSLSGGSLYAARRLGLQTVLWTAWGRDWRSEATPTSVRDALLPDLVGGATILLHDSDCTSAPLSWLSTLGALPLLAHILESKKLTAVSLSAHIQGRSNEVVRAARQDRSDCPEPAPTGFGSTLPTQLDVHAVRRGD